MKHNSLLKGALSPLILKLLSDAGQLYGYQIIQKIKKGSAGQMQITEGALYPALHKLEQEGLLEVEFREVSGRTRKYYRLSAKGKKACSEKLNELTAFMEAMQNFLTPKIG